MDLQQQLAAGGAIAYARAELDYRDRPEPREILDTPAALRAGRDAT